MGNGPSPPGPATAGIPREILDEYFRSIEEPFRETRVGMAKNDGPSGVFILVFILCLIPLIPYLFHKLLVWRFGSMSISLYSIHLDLASFWLLWVGLFVGSLLLMLVATKVSGPSKEEKRKWLSLDQMRFVYCYKVIDEIRTYRTNHIDRHIDKAIQYLQKTTEFLMPPVPFGKAEIIYPREPYLRTIATIWQMDMHPKWYRLRPETELIMEAFHQFTPKLWDRIRNKKDLATVEGILTALAGYYYTEIRELSSDQSETNFERVGEESLLSFAQLITGLSPYLSEGVQLTPEEKITQKIKLVGNKVSMFFTHDNVLIAFCSWYILMLLVFCVGFYLAFRLVPTTKIDTTIVTALVGGPITTAVAAVTIPRLTKTRNH
jgi:hypothetical protein